MGNSQVCARWAAIYDDCTIGDSLERGCGKELLDSLDRELSGFFPLCDAKMKYFGPFAYRVTVCDIRIPLHDCVVERPSL